MLVNLLFTVVATFVFRAMKVPEGTDGTAPEDYIADEGDPRVHELPDPLEDRRCRPAAAER